MNLKTVFEICSQICDKHIDKNPNACITYEDKRIPYTDIKHELDNIKEWCYPTESNNLRKCTYCQDCKHYKPYTHIQGGTKVTVYRCSFDNLPKQPEHFCGYAEEKVQ